MTLVSSRGTTCRGTYRRDGDELGFSRFAAMRSITRFSTSRGRLALKCERAPGRAAIQVARRHGQGRVGPGRAWAVAHRRAARRRRRRPTQRGRAPPRSAARTPHLAQVCGPRPLAWHGRYSIRGARCTEAAAAGTAASRPWPRIWRTWPSCWTVARWPTHPPDSRRSIADSFRRAGPASPIACERRAGDATESDWTAGHRDPAYLGARRTAGGRRRRLLRSVHRRRRDAGAAKRGARRERGRSSAALAARPTTYPRTTACATPPRATSSGLNRILQYVVALALAGRRGGPTTGWTAGPGRPPGRHRRRFRPRQIRLRAEVRLGPADRVARRPWRIRSAIATTVSRAEAGRSEVPCRPS